MRALLRTAIILGGTAAVIAVVLLAIAAVTGAWAPAIAAAALGAIGIVVAVLMAVRVVERLTEATNRTATRLKNVERSEGQLVDRAAALESLATRRLEDLDGLLADVERLDARLEGTVSRLKLAESAVTGVRSALETSDDEMNRVRARAEKDRRAVEELHAELLALRRDTGAFAVRLDDNDSATASVRKSVRNLDTALTKTRERLEPVRRDLRTLRERVPSGFLDPVTSNLKDLDAIAMATMRSSFESGIQLDREPKSLLPRELAAKLFADYLRNEEYLKLKPLIESFDLLSTLNLATLRTLYRFYRSAGYWNLALLAVSKLHERSGRDSDAYAVAKLQSEIGTFSEPTLVAAELPDGDAYSPEGPILHMVGRVLPETQTGYTLRTQYTALAQVRKGLSVAVVGQAGITGRSVEATEHYTHQGIDYYLLPGSARSQMLLADWVRLNMMHLAELVQRIRPSILHAQSDFFNALIVSVVGKKYGIPTVYESRGFWEESWLSRTISTNEWAADAEMLFSIYGVPAAYELRRHAEEVARSLTDHVFTLAEVMREHIVESSQGALRDSDVTVVPNAVEAANFPVQKPDSRLAATIGLPEGALVIGYVSSLVEYEGIETLIEAFDLLRKSVTREICLMVVGDGAHRPSLESMVNDLSLPNVYFTGKVAHEDVLSYYGLIDVFVVPRKSTTVTNLVTPLKPFEAFATGRAVVLSDVRALREISDQSGVAETFEAGSPQDLARILETLINDPEKRREMGARASRWVRNHRNWDANATAYYRVYRTLGYDGPADASLEAEISLSSGGLNVAELLDIVASSELPPLTGWFSIGKKSTDPEALLKNGWQFSNFEPIHVATIDDWAKYSSIHRTWGFRLHTWEFLDALLRAHDETKEERWIHEASRIAVSWLEFQESVTEAEDPMVWYDMAQALRLPRLLALASRAARVSGLRGEAILFAGAVLRHLEELSRERAFNPNNNHGFYTAASQVHAAKYGWMFPGAEHAGLEGRERLEIMTASQFAADGIQREHSPDYHRMLLGSFEQAVNDGLIDDKDVQFRLIKAARALGWMVQPDGTLVQFGDSPERKVVRAGAQSIDGSSRFVVMGSVASLT